MTVYPTHLDIIIDVKIPCDWENLSYHHDLCPSFGVNGLQIFVCDNATRDAEGLENKYSIILQKEYGEGKTLLDTNNWNKVMHFVKEHTKKNFGGKNANK